MDLVDKEKKKLIFSFLEGVYLDFQGNIKKRLAEISSLASTCVKPTHPNARSPDRLVFLNKTRIPG